MNRFFQRARRSGTVSSARRRVRRTRVTVDLSPSGIEVLEDRTLLSLDLNNIAKPQGAGHFDAVQNVSITQDVATFNDTDSTAAASDFTATINWGDGSDTTAGTITEDASDVFHVTGTHTYAQAGSFPITVTIKDLTNGTLYATNAFNQTNVVSSVAGMAGVTDPSLINPWGTSSSSTSPIWVSDQGSGLSTLYNPNGSPIKEALTVTIPSARHAVRPDRAGLQHRHRHDATSPSRDRAVRSVPSSSSATLDGTIAGWNPASTGGASTALTAATVTGAAFTGLAQASCQWHVLPLRRRLHGDHRHQRHRRLRPHLHQRLRHHFRRQVYRPQRRRGLRALQHRLSQRQPLCRLRPAFGNRDHAAAAISTSSTPAATSSVGSTPTPRAPISRAPGGWPSPPAASARSAATSWSAASATRRPPPATGRSASSASPPRPARSWAR